MDLILKNGELEPLITFLTALPLNIKESRMRNRLKKKIKDHVENIILPERHIMFENYAELDENSKYKSDKDGLIIFKSDAHKKEADRIWQDFMDEEYILECNSANAMMLKTMSQIFEKIEDSEDLKISGDESEMVEEWMDKFAEIYEYYTSTKDK